jgi:hypothetical protein
MTTPAPTPAGPTTIPEPDAVPMTLKEVIGMYRLLPRAEFSKQEIANVCETAMSVFGLLARERRRCEALVKALREIALHDTVDAPCEHLTSEGCRAWIEETAEEALKDAAKALQGQDGAK